jgi:hypothetical protein
VIHGSNISVQVLHLLMAAIGISSSNIKEQLIVDVSRPANEGESTHLVTEVNINSDCDNERRPSPSVC